MASRSLDEFETLTKILSNWKAGEDMETVLDWLYPSGIYDRQHEVASRRHKGTVQWLLEDDVFTNWQSGASDRVLWCCGDPGAGKTVAM